MAPRRASVAVLLAVAVLPSTRAKGPTWTCGSVHSITKPSLDDFALGCPDSCPYAAREDGNLCSASCLRSAEACREHNLRATWYSNVSDSGRFQCKECPVKGCMLCGETGDTCRKCFEGFVLEQQVCVIKGEDLVVNTVLTFAFIAVAVLLIIVCTTYGAQVFLVKSVSMATRGIKGALGSSGGLGERAMNALSNWRAGSESGLNEDQIKEVEEEQKLGLGDYDEQDEISDCEEGEVEQVEEAVSRDIHVVERDIGDLGKGLLTRVVAAEGVGKISAKQRHINKRAILHGLYFAKRSSVMAGLGGWKEMLSHQKVSADVGVGLPLFFNFQGFLCVVSAIVFVAMWIFENHFAFGDELRWLGNDDPDKCSQGVDVHKIEDQATRYAWAMVVTCLVLWLILLPLSWIFAIFQVKVTMTEFDRKADTFEDYTVKLSNVPTSLTSEARLKQIVEEKLQAQGKLHGVILTYDIAGIGMEARLREMVDNIVQLDDLNRGWCNAKFSRSKQELEAALEQDRREFIQLLQSGTLRSSGSAFLVYKRQRDVKVLLQIYRGIELEKARFEKEFGSLPCKDECYVMAMKSTLTEPPGVEWYNYSQNKPKMTAIFIAIHAVSLGLFAFFGWCSYLFFQYFMLPYILAGSPPDQDDMGLMIMGNFIGVINAGIQAGIQESAKVIGYNRVHSVDRTIFRLNTAVVALNIATQMFFFGYRGGFVRLLAAGGLPALQSEGSFALNIQVIMVPNMFFVQYLLNELFTALLPTTLSLVVMKMIYELQTGPLVFRQAIANVLPQPPKTLVSITGREAEVNLRLPPLLMSLEYTFCIVYPAAAFSIVFLISDQMTEMTAGLLLFSLFFFLYQRFCSLWMYRQTTHDSPMCYQAAMSAWGLVLSIFPAAAVWWLWRLGQIPPILGFILVIAVFVSSAALFQYGLDNIDYFLSKLGAFEEVEVEVDPGVEKMMTARGYSWWNTNPIYVLKERHCRDMPGYESLPEDIRTWPEKNDNPKSFYESGTRFRHFPYFRKLR